jgi:hypothetical protein
MNTIGPFKSVIGSRRDAGKKAPTDGNPKAPLTEWFSNNYKNERKSTHFYTMIASLLKLAGFHWFVGLAPNHITTIRRISEIF